MSAPKQTFLLPGTIASSEGKLLPGSHGTIAVTQALDLHRENPAGLRANSPGHRSSVQINITH